MVFFVVSGSTDIGNVFFVIIVNELQLLHNYYKHNYTDFMNLGFIESVNEEFYEEYTFLLINRPRLVLSLRCGK